MNAELKQQYPAMMALVERALQEDFNVEFTTSRRAENFRRTFYKFRREAMKHLTSEEVTQLKSIKTVVRGKSLVFSAQGKKAPNEVLEALGLS